MKQPKPTPKELEQVPDETLDIRNAISPKSLIVSTIQCIVLLEVTNTHNLVFYSSNI